MSPLEPDAWSLTLASMTQTASVTIRYPGVLRTYVKGASSLAVAASDVRAVLAELERDFPSLHRNVCEETGRVRRHLNLFVNTENVRDLAGLDTALAPGDVITILPAVSGG
jgi:MoaD family protein